MLQLFGFELKLVSFSSEHERLNSENLVSFLSFETTALVHYMHYNKIFCVLHFGLLLVMLQFLISLVIQFLSIGLAEGVFRLADSASNWALASIDVIATSDIRLVCYPFARPCLTIFYEYVLGISIRACARRF